MANRITKVKLKDGILVVFEENQEKTEKETVFKCAETPHPDLVLAFANLEKDVRKILHLPLNVWDCMVKITGVSFSESESTGIEGAVITGQVELENSGSPFCFNTPHLPFAPYSPGAQTPTFPEIGIRRLEKVREEAQKYMEGKRAQLELAGVK